MTPTLYVLMRTDMASMNAGKAMAQAAHAANAFGRQTESGVIGDAIGMWEESTEQGFGTTITLGVSSEQDMRRIVDQAEQFSYPAEVILDPTYPIRDGEVTHLIPVHTCAYVFVDDRDKHNVSLLRELELHP